MADPKIELLRQVPLFGGLSGKQLAFLATRCEDLDLPAGQQLCVEGRSGGDFFILVSGRAEVTRNGQRIRELTPGEFFGEIALLDHGPRTATVTTTEPSRCLALGPGQFADMLHADVEIAVQLLHSVVARLRAGSALAND